MTAPTLEGRLLCASGAAYAITGDARTLAPDPKDIYITGAGFVQPPAVFTAGPLSIDGCLVGEIPDGMVLAFRGTMPLNVNDPPTVRDWVGDFQADPIAVTGFPGAVHAGFSGALALLATSIAAELQKQRANTQPGRPLFITGHSKGGAMAALAAWSLHGTPGEAVKVVTFAAAMPGDSAFRAAYEAAGIDHMRYEYNLDIVPHLPLSDGGFIDVLSGFPLPLPLPGLGDFIGNLRRFDYQPVGTLQYIESNLQIVDDSTVLRTSRDQMLVKAIVELQFQQIAMDHSIGCGSGYMSAIAPTGVCAQ